RRPRRRRLRQPSLRRRPRPRPRRPRRAPPRRRRPRPRRPPHRRPPRPRSPGRQRRAQRPRRAPRRRQRPRRAPSRRQLRARARRPLPRPRTAPRSSAARSRSWSSPRVGSPGGSGRRGLRPLRKPPRRCDNWVAMHALSATTPADDVAEILLTAEEIAAKVKELGTEIARDYRGKDVVFVSILKGALPFLADLMRATPIPLALDFLEISSYGSSTETSGAVRSLKDLANPIEGRDVLVIARPPLAREAAAAPR